MEWTGNALMLAYFALSNTLYIIALKSYLRSIKVSTVSLITIILTGLAITGAFFFELIYVLNTFSLYSFLLLSSTLFISYLVPRYLFRLSTRQSIRVCIGILAILITSFVVIMGIYM